ncbi:MAG: Mbeg1-like protein [Christensenellales bacterium]|nr:Mbeg1-like protein [Christensenellales bacterium]
MANMLDYLAWRGDLPVDRDPLNENDRLIFSQLAYVAFDRLVPSGYGDSVALGEAASRLLAMDPEAETIHQTSYLWEGNKRLLTALSVSARFAPMRLSGYVSEISQEHQKQFAALTIQPGDGSVQVAFRGTDDTLVGWKEDLNMVFDAPVPAQREAVSYLCGAAALPGPLYVCGHSKGGNLAVYAAAHCPQSVQARIVQIINHDGPGMDEQTVASEGYARIRPRLSTYLPSFSIVGMMLEHEDTYTVVQSENKSVLQHDALSWQMMGARMLRVEQPSEASLDASRVLRAWIASLPREEQRLFADAVYEMATAAHARTLSDWEDNWPASALAGFSALRALEPTKRKALERALGSLFSVVARSIRLPWRKDEEISE